MICVSIHTLFRNTPNDYSSSPITFDDMLEIFNQTAIYIAKKNFKTNFWDSEPYLKNLRQNYVKWQKARGNRLVNYTPRKKPEYDPVPVEGLIEKWDTKDPKGTSQIKTIKILPMFGADAVRMYKSANESHTMVGGSASAHRLSRCS